MVKAEMVVKWANSGQSVKSGKKFLRIWIPHLRKPPDPKNLEIWSTPLRNTCTYLKKCQKNVR